MIKILIVDDHQMLREGFERAIFRTNILCQVEGVSSGKAAIELCQVINFDIAFMDINMPEMSGIEATKYITKKFVGVKVIGMSQFEDNQTIQKMKDAGAVGYMLKSEGDIHLKGYIKDTLKGKLSFPKKTKKEVSVMPGVIERLNNTTIGKYKFSAREVEVLMLMANGNTMLQIAEKLNLSSRTIEWHKGNLMLKLEVKNTVALINMAIKLGLEQ